MLWENNVSCENMSYRAEKADRNFEDRIVQEGPQPSTEIQKSKGGIFNISVLLVLFSTVAVLCVSSSFSGVSRTASAAERGTTKGETPEHLSGRRQKRPSPP